MFDDVHYCSCEGCDQPAEMITVPLQSSNDSSCLAEYRLAGEGLDSYDTRVSNRTKSGCPFLYDRYNRTRDIVIVVLYEGH